MNNKKRNIMISIVVALLIIVVVCIVLFHKSNELDVFTRFSSNTTQHNLTKLFGNPIETVDMGENRVRVTYSYKIEGMDGKLYAWFENEKFNGWIYWSYDLDSNTNYEEKTKIICDYFNGKYGSPKESTNVYRWEVSSGHMLIFAPKYVDGNQTLMHIEYR